MAVEMPKSAPIAEAKLDLREDWLTAWTADPAGLADIDAHLRGSDPPAGPAVQWLVVPRPIATPMTVPVLHPHWHVALHRVARSLRAAIDSFLPSGVIGYRNGSDPTQPYARRWQEFQSRTRQLASESAWVVFADVQSFFPSTSWHAIVRAVNDLEDSDVVREVEKLGERLTQDGLTCLPAGYGDARMLANVLLAPVDRDLGMPFLRWVDDYRIFVRRRPNAALATLRRALAKRFLHLNEQKARVVTGREAVEASENSLASAYHPEHDDRVVVLEKLRTLLDEASIDPISARTRLRFALARMERERDPYGIPFALAAMEWTAWEAPRLVSYLRHFTHRDDVATGCEVMFVRAVERHDAWLAARLAPLLAAVGLSRATTRLIGRHLEYFVGTPAWGLLLRAVSYSGDAGTTVEAAKNAYDARAALAALRDVEVDFSPALARREPALAKVLASRPAPLPELHSLL